MPTLASVPLTVETERGSATVRVNGETVYRIRAEADQLVLGTLRGPVTVLVDGETQYRVQGVDDASLDDVTPGTAVGARGTWNEDGVLQAAGVVVLGGR